MRMWTVYVPIRGGVTGDSYAIRSKCGQCEAPVDITIVNSLEGRNAQG
jgi:hypothetical protein